MKWLPFSEVVTDATAKFKKIKATDYHVQGLYKIIDQGKEAIAGYTDDANLVNGQLLPVVIFGDHTRLLKYVDEPIALGADGAKALWVNPGLANARYVYYYLRSIQIKEAGYSRHFKFLKEIEIPIPFKDGAPDFDDQIRIAHLLGKVEGLIAQRKQHLQQLDDLLRGVFLEMFGDPVRNEKGWVPTTIGDSVEIQSGQVDPRELPYSELPHVGGANIESGSGNFIELKQAKYENLISGKYLFDSEYILYSKIRPYLNKVSKPNFRGICSADIYPIKPIDSLLNRDFLRMLLMSKAFLNYTANNSDRANIPKINRKALVAFGFNRPPIDLQNQFAGIVEKVEGIKSHYQKSLTDLENLYGALSQQAFKGELDLSRLPLPGILAEAAITVATEPEQTLAKQGLAINLPATDHLPDALENAEARKGLMAQWLEAYRGQLGSTPFSVQRFMAAAQTRLAELHPDNDFELGVNDYEHIKTWVFDALDGGALTQACDDAGNRVELKAAFEKSPA